MPRKNPPTGHADRQSLSEDACHNLDQACSQLNMVGDSLQDDDQLKASEPWLEAASEVQALIAKIRKLAR